MPAYENEGDLEPMSFQLQNSYKMPFLFGAEKMVTNMDRCKRDVVTYDTASTGSDLSLRALFGTGFS